jgi:tetratricopeptide (TPR) repeat protein
VRARRAYASSLALAFGLATSAPARAIDQKADPKASASTAGAAAASTPAASTGSLKAAAERNVTAAPAPKAGTPKGSARESARGRPAIRGPKLPPEVIARLRSQLDARVDNDLKQARVLRNEAIGLLTTFVAETPREATELPEALMRLGELRWEVEREQLVERFRAWEKKPVDQRGPSPVPDYGPARELFGRVLKDYPRFRDYDLALYVDGFLATEQGKEDEALGRFERILREYPRSRFVPDAHMAKAEALFSAKYDYPAALAEYERVLAFKKSDLYGLALFKSAWCLWRLGRSDEAARRFVSVFEVTDQAQNASAAQRRQLDELQGEALKYLVEVFTEDDRNTATDVHRFLQKIGGDRFASRVVKALAVQFYDRSQYERGVEAYELLLRLDPTNRDAGLWVLDIANGYNTVENWPKLNVTYQRLLRDYLPGGTWARTQADTANVQATTAKIEQQLRDHALALHAKAQRDKTSRAEFEGAASLYATYLSRFGNAPQAYQASFYLAEIYFYRLERNTDAATAYMAAARAIPDKDAQKEPLRTLRRDAIYNAIAALERVRVGELEARKGKAGAQETESDRKFAEALDLYAQLYPTDPALPELFFRQGRLYYEYGVYDPAVKIWGALLERFPRSQFAQPAGELILDSFNKSKNYENIETWARRLKAAPAFQGREQQQKLDVLIVQSVFKQGEQKTATGDHAGAAKAYLRAAKEFPRDARAAQACVNAISSSQKAGDVVTLRDAAQLVVGKEYRDKQEAPQGAWMAASSFQAMGLYADAADLNEAIATSNEKSFQKFEKTKDAAYNAVILRAALGEHEKAVQDGTRYLQNYGSSAEADDVVFQMGRAHQAAGRNKEAVDLYKRFLGRAKSVDDRVKTYVLLAKAQLRTGDEKGADESLRAGVAIGKRQRGTLTADGKYAAAEARYMEGERVLTRFEKIQIQGDVKQLSARLKQKAELLKQAATVFLDTVSLGVAEWTTAALFQIGRTYELFAKAMRDAPAPSNLSDAEKEAYQTQIDGFVVPIEERSLNAYEDGWKKALELGIYNQWTAKMREALGRLNSELYPPLREIGVEVRSVSPTPFPPLLDAPRRGVTEAKPGAPGPAPAVTPAPAAPATTPAKKEPPKPRAPAKGAKG